MNETKIIAEPGKQELFIIREFDAPRDMVFKACSDADLITEWLGPRGMVMKIDSYDARTNGHYRYIHTDPSGNSYAFRGTFHDVSFPERTIQTFEFEGLPEKGHVSLETARFEELPGNRTRITIQSVFQSVTDRDGMIRSGMERGVKEGHQRLDELLAKGF